MPEDKKNPLLVSHDHSLEHRNTDAQNGPVHLDVYGFERKNYSEKDSVEEGGAERTQIEGEALFAPTFVDGGPGQHQTLLDEMPNPFEEGKITLTPRASFHHPVTPHLSTSETILDSDTPMDADDELMFDDASLEDSLVTMKRYPPAKGPLPETAFSDDLQETAPSLEDRAESQALLSKKKKDAEELTFRRPGLSRSERLDSELRDSQVLLSVTTQTAQSGSSARVIPEPTKQVTGLKGKAFLADRAVQTEESATLFALAETEVPTSVKGAVIRHSGVRRYSDGLLVTSSGKGVSGQAGQGAFELPYPSSNVLMRLDGYDLLEEVGKGGMGIVYKAYSLSLCRTCAVKVMQPDDGYTEADILRFQNEAILAGRLRHPNIISVFDSGEAEGRFYFAMEYIKGKSFEDLVEDPSMEALDAGLRALAKIARALELAHNKGIIHRDIKPDNILLDGAGEPYLTDFGVAKDYNQRLNLTATHSAIGTPYYMSPEQANGELHRIGPHTDVYTLGATLYHLLTNRYPFPGTNFMEVLFGILSKEPESPCVVAKRMNGRELPLALEVICLKAMEKDAKDRYASAAEFASELEAYLEQRPIQARPPNRKERLQKLLRRNRAFVVLSSAIVGILMLMTLAFGSVMIFNIQRTSDSLRALDRKAAVDQAAMLERAIRTNMLEGRADMVRELVQKLRKAPDISSIDVIRTNQTYAYTDMRTRRFVERRLRSPKAVAWIEKNYPKILPKIKELKRIALPNIARNLEKKPNFLYDSRAWERYIKTPSVKTQIDELNGERVLTVLWPVANGKACQACHGRVGQKIDSYDASDNRLRAVLVVRRSLRDVEGRIHANQMATFGVGLVTTAGFLLLLLMFTRLFDVGLKPRAFGVTASHDSTNHLDM